MLSNPPLENTTPILTRWAHDVAPAKPLPEYPRPQMARVEWQNLNGPWEYALTAAAVTAPPAEFSGQITVPFPYESTLSGVGKASVPDQRLWYRRTFTLPPEWDGQRLLLHFGAVNWDCTVFLNGQLVGSHCGGFERFSFDVTDALRPDTAQPNELIVSAWNPVGPETVVGKQSLTPGGIFYTAATGIWQTVWIEPVPAEGAITGLKLTPNLDAGALRVIVYATAGGAPVRVIASDGNGRVAAADAVSGAEVILPIPNARRWSPNDPHLYNLQVELLHEGRAIDLVDSYFGMRKISLGQDAEGCTRILLNNEFLFERGVLDQGYWPDGIFTAPTDEALRWDLEMTKQLGFNLSRKHAKVEPDRWYYHADRLGLLVWQDMPQMYADPAAGELPDLARRQFETEWRALVGQLHNHPSIVVWTTFNEGWGQHDTERVAALTKELDPSRLVNSASGWTDRGVGDLHDTHHYPAPACELPETARATVNGEFGGIGLREEGHMWSRASWGYEGMAPSAWQATRRYRDLLESAYRLRDERGMSAYVYTQLTDVESESNGLFTYDRAVLKMDPQIVAAANRGEFLPLPPNPTPDFLPTAQEAPRESRFTTVRPPEGWDQPGFDDRSWEVTQGRIEGEKTQEVTGELWMRQTVTLPASLPEQLVFHIYHNDAVEVYVNGVLAATTPSLPSGYVRTGMRPAARAALCLGEANVIAVHSRHGKGEAGVDLAIGPGENVSAPEDRPKVDVHER